MVQIRKYCEKFRLTVSSPLFLCVVKYLDTNKISTASTNSLTYHLFPYLPTLKQNKVDTTNRCEALKDVELCFTLKYLITKHLHIKDQIFQIF